MNLISSFSEEGKSGFAFIITEKELSSLLLEVFSRELKNNHKFMVEAGRNLLLRIDTEECFLEFIYRL